MIHAIGETISALLGIASWNLTHGIMQNVLQATKSSGRDGRAKYRKHPTSATIRLFKPIVCLASKDRTQGGHQSYELTCFHFTISILYS
jgi:hypothetical protein